MRKVKAILIDPFRCVVEHVELDGDDYRSYYPLLSHETQPVQCFTTAWSPVLESRDAIFVDDEGLLGSPQRFFEIAGAYQPFAGKGLIVGADGDGDAVDAETALEEVRAAVRFAEPFGERLIVTSQPWEPRNEKS